MNKRLAKTTPEANTNIVWSSMDNHLQQESSADSPVEHDSEELQLTRHEMKEISLHSEANIVHGDNEVIEMGDDDNGEDNDTNDSSFGIVDLLHRLKEIFFAFLPMGFITFGGPQAHIGLLQAKFVHTKQWLTNDQFVELFALGQALPGPTSTQVAIAIGTIRAGYLGGLLTFFMFGLPGMTVLFVLGCGMYYGMGENPTIPEWTIWIQHGLSCCAVALVASAAWKLSSKIDKMFTRLLLIFGAVSTIAYRKAWMLPILLVAGGLYGLIHIKVSELVSNRLQLNEQQSYSWMERVKLFVKLLRSFKKSSTADDLEEAQPSEAQESPIDEEEEITDEKPAKAKQEQQPSNLYLSIPFRPSTGVIIAISFITILVSSIVLRQFVEWKLLALFEGFLRMGSYIVGGGQVVLPLIMVEFSEKNHFMTKDQFMNGFAIASALPGPMFNLSIYLGAIMYGVPGAIVSFVGLFTPAFAFIWGVLPFWSRYREKPIIQRVLVGVNAVAVGLVYASVYLLWTSVSSEKSNDSITLSIVTVIIDFALLHIADVTAPAVVVFSGLFRFILNLIFKC